MQNKGIIPSRDDLMNTTKHKPINWNALTNFDKSPNQPDSWFDEQRLPISTAASSIDDDYNVFHTRKNVTIIGSAGCGNCGLCSMLFYILLVLDWLQSQRQ